MRVDTKLYFPGHIADIKEFQELAYSFDSMLQPLWEVMKRIHDNQYIDTLDDYGCRMHEGILGISVNPIDELDDRRRRIKGYYTSNLPYTSKKMNEVLTAMCGKDGYDLVIDAKLSRVTVNIKLNSVSLINNVYELIRQMIPASMVLSVEIIYNIHARFRSMTHEAMGQYTHEELRAGKIFLKNYNMHCNLGRRSHEELSEYTHNNLFENASILEE